MSLDKDNNENIMEYEDVQYLDTEDDYDHLNNSKHKSRRSVLSRNKRNIFKTILAIFKNNKRKQEAQNDVVGEDIIEEEVIEKEDIEQGVIEEEVIEQEVTEEDVIEEEAVEEPQEQYDYMKCPEGKFEQTELETNIPESSAIEKNDKGKREAQYTVVIETPQEDDRTKDCQQKLEPTVLLSERIIPETSVAINKNNKRQRKAKPIVVEEEVIEEPQVDYNTKDCERKSEPTVLTTSEINIPKTSVAMNKNNKIKRKVKPIVVEEDVIEKPQDDNTKGFKQKSEPSGPPTSKRNIPKTSVAINKKNKIKWKVKPIVVEEDVTEEPQDDDTNVSTIERTIPETSVAINKNNKRKRKAKPIVVEEEVIEEPQEVIYYINECKKSKPSILASSKRNILKTSVATNKNNIRKEEAQPIVVEDEEDVIEKPQDENAKTSERNSESIPKSRVATREKTKKQRKTQIVVREDVIEEPQDGEQENAYIEETFKVLIKSTNITPFRTVGSQIICSYCDLKINDNKSFHRHMSQHAVTERCNFDSQKLYSVANDKKFLKLDVTDLKCQICMRNLKWTRLIRHLRGSHNLNLKKKDFNYIPYVLNDDFTCVLCKKEFANFMLLNDHMEVHFVGMTCTLCDFEFFTERALEKHKTTHSIIQCEHCPKTLYCYTAYLRHRKIHNSKKKPLKCFVCSELFVSQRMRYLHTLKLHKGPESAKALRKSYHSFTKVRGMNNHTYGTVRHFSTRRLKPKYNK